VLVQAFSDADLADLLMPSVPGKPSGWCAISVVCDVDPLMAPAGFGASVPLVASTRARPGGLR